MFMNGINRGIGRAISIINNFKLKYLRCLIGLSLLFFSFKSYCQTISVSDNLMQDHYRVSQLAGDMDSNVSLNLRPISYSLVKSPSGGQEFSLLPKDIIKKSDLFQVKILPITFNQQYNSSNSYGWNDGLMIPAKGYQNYISAGFFVKAGPLTIQAQPEFVYASNPEYLVGNDKVASDRYSSYISLNNYGADLPAYYETENFTKLGVGQSSIRLNFGPASLGISSENLWWGPGRRTALIMSNNARGFRYITLNTSHPIITPIGALEGQIIAGRLENSNSSLNLNKKQDWRYLSGMIFNYQPKWVPGLSVGLTRVFQIYNTDINGLNDYVPLFQPFEKKRSEEDGKRRDQLTSVFAKYIFKEAHAEVYAEFARNDHSFNVRDFLQEPQHSRAYLFGFQKLISAFEVDENFLISAEVTRLSQPLNRSLRSAGTWYVHDINQGYTNGGEVLGAGTGPGGNLQNFEFSWLKGLKKIGIQIERFEHNRDYYQEILDPGDNYKEQWVDLSAGVLVNWNFKNLMGRSKIAGVQSLNYLWQTGIDDLPQRNQFNLHANIGLFYYFK